ncbi:hypothetical protein GH714_009221 [Hevea brasiliensis]|uniref:RNase H type-1 domain-containing protein n=1 Tax=Hevea brasiliensis TaxID=3981 RepID=A0A6A6N297_HEVBR|nr:hypothetical protein GH714_009221 [Hevea brasiliensis]
MQIACIPQAVCHEVDKLCRQFIWGASADKKKIALVSWERVQLPKEMGGLGFRNLSMLNNAFLLKLAWEISTNPHALWVQVIWSKYKNGVCWSLGNGKLARFWLDAWLPDGIILQRIAIQPIPEDLLNETIASYVTTVGLHVLRDCVVASYIWKHFVPRNDWAEFFSSNTDLRNWAIQNLSKCDREVQNMHWPFLFGFICWSIWGRRNCSLFGENDLSLDSMIHVMTCKAQDWYSVVSRLPGKIDSCMKTITTVSWTCPPDNVFKLNTDGSLPNLGGIACGGGLIRDSNGRWIKGFKAVFEKTSVLGAELWSILEGMKLAKSLGLKDIIVESDNLIAVQILTRVLQPPGAVLSVVSAIQFILTPDWKVTFSHVLRDANYAADWKTRGMGAARKLKSHRRRQRWADKAYKKSHLGNEWKKPFAGSSHAKGIVLEKSKQPNSAIRKCARVQLIKNGKKIAAFVPNDGCLNFIEENDEVLIAGFGRKGHAVGDIPGVRFKVVKVSGVSLLALFKEKKEKPRS